MEGGWGGRMGGGGADGPQWKSTADSCNPRSLSQLDMIVMESLGQNPEERIPPAAAGLAALSASLKGRLTLYICIVHACCGEQADLVLVEFCSPA